MLTSELIAELTALLHEHGDLPAAVTVDGPGTYTGGRATGTWCDTAGRIVVGGAA